MASYTKEEYITGLSKSLKDMTDTDLREVAGLPEAMWPTNPFQHTTKILTEEQARRTKATDLTFQQVLDDVMHITLLRHLVAYGPRIFPEMDLLGGDDAADEIRRLEPIVKRTVQRYKAQRP